MDSPEAWEQVVSRVKDRKLMVGVFLAESRRMGWDGATLCLGADEVHQSLLEARENRDLLAEILNSVYGRRVTVRFVRKEAGNGAGASAAAPAAAEAAASAASVASLAPGVDAPRVTVARPGPPSRARRRRRPQRRRRRPPRRKLPGTPRREPRRKPRRKPPRREPPRRRPMRQTPPASLAPLSRGQRGYGMV